MDNKPTPPEGYELIWGRGISVVKEGYLLWDSTFPKWVPSSNVGNQAAPNMWYAVPIQKPTPVPEIPTNHEQHVVLHLSALDTQIGGKHYKSMVIQPAEFCIKNGIGFVEGAVIKYVCRHEQKNGAEDLDKAIHLLQILREVKYGKP